MQCSKCGSVNVNVVPVTETKTKKHGTAWWIFVGWWWWLFDMLIWIFLFIPRLIWRAGSKSKITSKTHTEAVCQNCGNRWIVKDVKGNAVKAAV